MSAQASLSFFVRHEARLAWREWLWWLRGTRRGLIVAGVVGLLFLAGAHVATGFAVRPFADLAARPTVEGYLMLGAAFVMAFMLLVSQAIESATRVIYARGDVELVLSSPAPAQTVFVLRLAMLAAAETALSVGILGAFVNMLAITGGARWLAAHGVLVAMGLIATAVAILLAIGLFRLFGPRRARAIAQIVAAVIGGSMVIGLQLAAILGHQGLSRFAALNTQAARDLAPPLDSPVWLPLRAATGEAVPLALVMIGAIALVSLTILFAARALPALVVAAAGAAQGPRRNTGGLIRFDGEGPRAALRAKELALLARDPWLISQSLIQILYLLPPAAMLWMTYGGDGNSAPLIAPVIVMAAGQLAGGLAWLAISGEDAPDLVATAPVPAGSILRAKIEAVTLAVAAPLLPLVAGLALLSPWAALACIVFSGAAAASATAIQLMFRSQAKRSAFRRRQTASRVSTIAEAFSSIAWAGAGGLATAGHWLALIPIAIAIGVLGVVRALAPARSEAQIVAKTKPLATKDATVWPSISRRDPPASVR